MAGTETGGWFPLVFNNGFRKGDSKVGVFVQLEIVHFLSGRAAKRVRKEMSFLVVIGYVQ